MFIPKYMHNEKKKRKFYFFFSFFINLWVKHTKIISALLYIIIDKYYNNIRV